MTRNGVLEQILYVTSKIIAQKRIKSLQH